MNMLGVKEISHFLLPSFFRSCPVGYFEGLSLFLHSIVDPYCGFQIVDFTLTYTSYGSWFVIWIKNLRSLGRAQKS